MKKSFFLILTVIIFAIISLDSCSDNSLSPYSYDEPTIYSSSNSALFSEVIFFLKPYIEKDGEKRYIATDSIYNISLDIKNTIRKISNSYQLDTLHLYNKETIGMYRTTTDEVHYPVAINIRVTPEKLNTAGEYSNLLNNYLTLAPGAYVCQITSFDLKTIKGNFQTIHTPFLSVPLIVEENSVSSNLGVLEVIIK